MRKLNVAIIGAGKIGTAFALDFFRKKIKIVAVVDKDLKKARKLSQKIKSDKYSDKISDIPSIGNLFVIAVQDRFIKEVADDLANSFNDFSDKAAFHTSGALSCDELIPLEKKGALIFSLHPNFSLVSAEPERQKIIKFNQSIFAIEAKSKKALSFAKSLCDRLGYEFIRINSDEKVLYHIFSVLISNYTVSKFLMVEKYLGRKFFKSYLNLLKSTIQNIEEFGSKKALTGPIVRNDIETIRRHLNVLSKFDKRILDIYRNFGFVTIEMIREQLGEEASENLMKILEKF